MPSRTNYADVVSRVLLLLLVLLTAAGAQTREASPFSGDAREIDAGRASFRLRCSACHGIHAEGGRGPSLNRGEFNVGNSDKALYQVIAKGVPGSEMPAFGKRNTEESIWRIVSYLRSLTAAETVAVTGDSGRGEIVFWQKSGCGNCHRVGKRGGYFGPSLTRIGRSRSVNHLRESVVSPDADLPVGYYAVEIKTTDGGSIRGLGLGFDDFSSRLRDASGDIHSYFHEEVRSAERKFESLMPSGYAESLSESELDDLLAYLVSLREEK